MQPHKTPVGPSSRLNLLIIYYKAAAVQAGLREEGGTTFPGMPRGLVRALLLYELYV